MICTNCGNEIPDGATFCPTCGNMVEHNEENEVAGCFHVFAKLGNILGIISIAGSIIMLGFITGVPGIVFSILGLRSPINHDKAKKGLTMSIIGLVVSTIILTIIYAVIFISMLKETGSFDMM